MDTDERRGLQIEEAQRIEYLEVTQVNFYRVQYRCLKVGVGVDRFGACWSVRRNRAGGADSRLGER